MATKKQPTKTTKKAPATRSATASKTASAKKKSAPAPVKEAPKRKKGNSALAGAMPYILIVLGLIIGIAFFTVQILDMDDGAGVIGYAIQYFFCGLFGIAALLTPLALIYIGVKWCVYNVKKKETFGKRKTDVDEEDFRTYKNRNILQTVMAVLLVLFVATIIGVFSDAFDSFEIGEMWVAGAEDLEGGGLFGGMLSVLMVMAFEKVISAIIVILVIALAFILMIGLTPDRIVIYFRERHRIAREARLEAEEEARLEMEAELASLKKSSAIPDR